MKKILLIVLLAGFGVMSAGAQGFPKYWVKFKDKSGSQYSVSNPSQFLTQKALDRRTAHGVQITMQDIPVVEAYVDSVASFPAVKVVNRSRWFNFITAEIADTNSVNSIQSLPFVDTVQLVYPVGMQKKRKKKRQGTDHGRSSRGTQSLDFFPALEQLTNNAPARRGVFVDYSAPQIQSINLDLLHAQGKRGRGMTIAVLDAGFYAVDTMMIFDSLWNNNRILGVRDFVNVSDNVFTKSTHGMAVLSIMGGRIESDQYAFTGTAPEAKYWLLRSEDAGTEYIVEEGNWVAAAEFADSVGVDIINSSLGYTTFDDTLQNHTYADMNGQTSIASISASIAASKGILVVNSAGNSGNKAWHYIGAPADADSILTIGAMLGADSSISNFSSWGPSSDGRQKPNVVAIGEGTYTATAYPSSGNPLVVPGNGTSFSSPVMAGAAACLWQDNPGMTNQQVIKAIEESSHMYGNPDYRAGYGVPNMFMANLVLSDKEFPDFDEDENIEVFPNPFSDNLFIVFNSSDTQFVSVAVYDLSGRKVFFRENVKRSLGITYFSIRSIADLSDGVYVLRVYSKDKTFSRKIVKR